MQKFLAHDDGLALEDFHSSAYSAGAVTVSGAPEMSGQSLLAAYEWNRRLQHRERHPRSDREA
jgi:hypothetical protein